VAIDGVRNLMAAGNLLGGTANLLMYQPSANNAYANVSDDTGVIRYYRLTESLTFTPVVTETGHRRTFAKVIVGDLLTDGVANVIVFDRYRG
jgi:hypothetical protein